jgi:hypothetical protein
VLVGITVTAGIDVVLPVAKGEATTMNVSRGVSDHETAAREGRIVALSVADALPLPEAEPLAELLPDGIGVTDSDVVGASEMSSGVLVRDSDGVLDALSLAVTVSLFHVMDVPLGEIL